MSRSQARSMTGTKIQHDLTRFKKYSITSMTKHDITFQSKTRWLWPNRWVGCLNGMLGYGQARGAERASWNVRGIWIGWIWILTLESNLDMAKPCPILQFLLESCLVCCLCVFVAQALWLKYLSKDERQAAQRSLSSRPLTSPAVEVRHVRTLRRVSRGLKKVAVTTPPGTFGWIWALEGGGRCNLFSYVIIGSTKRTNGRKHVSHKHTHAEASI